MQYVGLPEEEILRRWDHREEWAREAIPGYDRLNLRLRNKYGLAAVATGSVENLRKAYESAIKLIDVGLFRRRGAANTNIAGVVLLLSLYDYRLSSPGR